MPTHWTYDACAQDDDLMQGDVLAPTAELRSLFREVHPHFVNDKYLAFVIITQSCDLARREGKCSARYISVAVVRSLSAVLFGLLDTVCDKLKDGVYPEKARSRAHDLLERVFNQNEHKLGLFYFYPDGDIGIGEDAVAYLRVSVAFWADHYDVMRGARRGRLKPEFANKLGWIVGNLYSRVGTEDWPRESLEQMIRSYLAPVDPDRPTWVDERHIRALKRQNKTPNDLSRQELVELAKKKAASLREAGIDQMIVHVRELFSEAPPEILKQLRTTLMNDLDLKSFFKE